MIKLLGTRFLELKAAVLLALATLCIALLTGIIEIRWFEAFSDGFATAVIALVALASGILFAIASPTVFESARKRYLFRKPFLLANLSFLAASVAIWLISIYSPKALHLNRGPNLGQTVFLIPHRIVFASLEFPADPNAQAASRLRPPDFVMEDVNSRDYDGTFQWRTLGFQTSTGPYPQLLFVYGTGQVLSFTLHQSSFVVPLWIFPPIFSVVPNLYLLGFLRRYTRDRQGFCRFCRYDLRAHKVGDKCPECGRPVMVESATIGAQRSVP